MYLDYTPAQHELRDQLRAYFAGLLTPVVKEAIATEGHNGPTSLEVRQKMGADGWLGIGWPREYGGQGRSVLEQFVFFDEATRAQAPVPMIALNTVGPTLMRHGSDEQKDAFLPRILAGTLDVAIGYTEPGSGTDLASLRTKAERQGDEFVVNGNKVYTTGGLTADYVWLAARTNPDAPKHKGISILLVDTKTPGFSATPIVTVGGEVTSATYYEDVHVPASMVVGNVDEGWRLITSQLNHERVALAAMGGRSLELFEAVRQWAVDEGVIEVPWVRQTLARVYARLDALKLLNWRMAWKTDAGTLTPADASAGKVFGSETDIESYRLLLEIIGRAGMVQKGSPAAELAGVLEKAYRSAPVRTFGGGSNEVQREILVQTALGLPRGAR
ncbi:MAG: Acyl-CoA dehydrogenase, long-chain specific, mitochondrial precursor [Frankiales bacterium]|nr:Acyl-CoA dehydrogenase, long-chain specific, mitochondrial precursor [Frankiales bacterium]